MVQLNSALLKQFHQHGISINEGVAEEARLIKSANRPASNVKLKEIKEKADTPEGKLDRNGNKKKLKIS